MSRAWFLVACGLCVVGRASGASKRVEFNLAFSDEGAILHSVPIGPNKWAEVERMSLKVQSLPAPGGMFDGMIAECVGMTPGRLGSDETVGWCEFKDAAGDTTTEHYTGIITETGGQGTATFSGGTGKYKNLVSAHSWRYHFIAQNEDSYSGQGTKHGFYYYTETASESSAEL